MIEKVTRDNIEEANRNAEKLEKLREKGITNIGIYNEEYPILNGIKYYRLLTKRDRKEVV
jgi:hypothetical protein